MAVIHDNQCREYAEGWNACNAGKLLLPLVRVKVKNAINKATGN
jgi:hypothetical protein